MEGNGAVQVALSSARSIAGVMKSYGVASPEMVAHSRGMSAGMIIIARSYLGADPDVVMAAENEINFLLGTYLEADSAAA
jgi:hypothetical protein